MKISTKGRYALRLMLDLALRDSGEPIRLKDVAHRQGISEKYLEQAMCGVCGGRRADTYLHVPRKNIQPE